MQVKGFKPLSHYQKFLDTELFLTEQLDPLTKQSLCNLKNTQSEQLSKSNRNDLNLRQAIYHQLFINGQMKEGIHRRQIFQRQNFSTSSKKQRDIRKRNYEKSPNKSPLTGCLVESGHLQIKQAGIARGESAQLRRPLSSSSHRPVRSASAKGFPQKSWASRPQTATRPQTSTSRLSRIQVAQNTEKYFQFRKQNPLVIYPFQSHLKVKRIDENPKVLANMITKKNKFMSKQELYEYVSKIMQRRPK